MHHRRRQIPASGVRASHYPFVFTVALGAEGGSRRSPGLHTHWGNDSITLGSDSSALWGRYRAVHEINNSYQPFRITDSNRRSVDITPLTVKPRWSIR